MGELKALIFDVDGTLADTEECHRRAFNATFATRGLDWTWSRADYAKLLQVTGGKERIAHYMRDWLNTDPEGLNIAELHKEKTAAYGAMLARGEVALRPGVKRLLNEALDHGLTLAVATTTSMANVTGLIEQALGSDMRRALAVIAAGDSVTAKKPAPDIYQYALQAMDLDPVSAVAFEDSNAGLRSARSAGLATIVTVNRWTHDQDFAGAISVLSDLGEEGAPACCWAGAAPDGGRVCVGWIKAIHAAVTCATGFVIGGRQIYI